MTVDITKLQYYSGYPIDKITVEDTTSYSMAGAGGLSTNTSLQTVTNPFGQRCLSTCSYSVDNINFYDQNTALPFFSTFHQTYLTQMQVQCGSSDTTIYFFLQSNYQDGAGNPLTQTVYINYALDFPT